MIKVDESLLRLVAQDGLGFTEEIYRAIATELLAARQVVEAARQLSDSHFYGNYSALYRALDDYDAAKKGAQ